MVIFHRNKKELRNIFIRLKAIIECERLNVKGNYQIFNIDKRPLDFVGYVYSRDKTFIRKRITKRARRTAIRNIREPSEKRHNTLMSYYGWYIHSDAYLLRNKYYEGPLT